MKDKQCELTRRELEELRLNDEFSTTAAEHLQACADCREFQREQTKLRQIVGSLGTVNAPADFDFRLRARLAADSQGANFRFWPFALKGIATAAVLGVFAFGAFVVWQRGHQPPEKSVAVTTPPHEQPAPRTEPAAIKTSDSSQTAPQRVVLNNNLPIKKINRPLQASLNPKRSLVAIDFSSERADLERRAKLGTRTLAVFPIQTSLQPLTVSLDDGRGNARTVSFPAVSFGSQRVPAIVSQLAPKNDW
jgi:hypothetical protein